MTRRRRSQRGFTLVELMVSLVLFAVVTAGMLSVATTMARGFREQEATITTESATRSTLDFLAEAVRAASPGVSALNITSDSCSTNALEILNNQIGGPTTHTSDRLTMVYPSGWVYTALDAPYVKGESAMTLLHSGDQLAQGDQLLVTDFTQGHIVTLLANPAGNVVSFNSDGCALPVAYTYGKGTMVIRVKRAAFYVRMLPSDALNAEVPALMMDSTPDNLADQTTSEEPIAEGIEDLQISVAIDADNNNTILETANGVGDEWIGNAAGESIPTNLAGSTVRAIRISLVARANRVSPGINFFQIPALEDRALVATNDSFRRRLLSTVIELRNLGGSP